MLYRGLARGQMSVAGPVSAVAAAGVPVAAGIAMGERPTVLARGMTGSGLTDGLADHLSLQFACLSSPIYSSRAIYQFSPTRARSATGALW
ncbi:MAG TPA: hypothetical protein VFW50_28485 [Streptosporangiaceae bacterium]|nr:hypothetical protein [Streptosporangiaceae bacterium]